VRQVAFERRAVMRILFSDGDEGFFLGSATRALRWRGEAADGRSGISGKHKIYSHQHD